MLDWTFVAPLPLLFFCVLFQVSFVLQLPSCAWAIKNDLGIRIGIEDNIWFDKSKKVFNKNAKLVRYAHDVMSEEGKEWMRPSQFGELGFYNDYRVI